MINDLDETLRQILIQEANIDPTQVEIRFDVPPRNLDPDSKGPVMVNLYLYDLRENSKLRELDWETSRGDSGRMEVKRLPVRIDLSYMITCWTNSYQDHHRLLWLVLAALFRNSPLPDRYLAGSLRKLLHPVRTEVAQPDGILQNPSDFWGAMENQVRPAINLVVTLELDLDQIEMVPLVTADTIKLGQVAIGRDSQGPKHQQTDLEPGWEGEVGSLGGHVRSREGATVPAATVRLLSGQKGSPQVQIGAAVQTDSNGRYIFVHVLSGNYILEVTPPGGRPISHALAVNIRERGEPVSATENELTVDVEVPTPRSRQK